MSEKVALVTGAGRGIGRAIALAFAGEGVCVVAAARTAPEIEETARLARERGAPEARAHADDLTCADALDRLLADVSGRWGRLDVLVQAAGLFETAPIEETADEAWDRALAVNLTLPFRLLRRALPLLRKAGGGHVFHLVSVAARRAFPGCAAYGASKAGLLGLTGVAREELRASGTKVTAVIPGAVDTSAWDGVSGRFDRTNMLRPEDVARAVIAAWRDAPGAMTEEIVLRPQGGDL